MPGDGPVVRKSVFRKKNSPRVILELRNGLEITHGELPDDPRATLENSENLRFRPKTRPSRILCASNIAILEAPRAPKVSIILKLIMNKCAGKLPIRDFEKCAKVCSKSMVKMTYCYRGRNAQIAPIPAKSKTQSGGRVLRTI